MFCIEKNKEVKEKKRELFGWKSGVGCAGSRQLFDMGIVAQSFASDLGLLSAFSLKPVALAKSGLRGLLLREHRLRNDRTTTEVLMQL